MRTVWIAAFVVACSAAPSPHAPAPVATAQPHVVAPPLVKNRPMLWFGHSNLYFYGAMIQHGQPPAPIGEDFAPGATVTNTDVECFVDMMAPLGHATCAARANEKPGAPTAAETDFRGRLPVCFHVRTTSPTPATLRALEQSLIGNRNRRPLLPTRPEDASSFITVGIHLREKVLHEVLAPPSCTNGPPHGGCDPIGPWTPTGRVTSEIVDSRTFAAYGPAGYVYSGQSGDQRLFTGTGAEATIAVPEMADRLGSTETDARFAVRNPPLTRKEAAKETLDRISAIPLEGEIELVQFALVLDRAVVAFEVGDDAAGKANLAALEAWMAHHTIAIDPQWQPGVTRTITTLKQLAAGAFRTHDPCAP